MESDAGFAGIIYQNSQSDCDVRHIIVAEHEWWATLFVIRLAQRGTRARACRCSGLRRARDGEDHIFGVGRLLALPIEGDAEATVLVADDQQSKGLGTQAVLQMSRMRSPMEKPLVCVPRSARNLRANRNRRGFHHQARQGASVG